MSRAKWKFNYIAKSILKKVSHIADTNQQFVVFERNSTIPSTFVNKDVLIHWGKDFKKVTITRNHIGFKFGEFAITRKFTAKEKKKKKGKK